MVGEFGQSAGLLDSIGIDDPATDRWRHGAPIPVWRTSPDGAIAGLQSVSGGMSPDAPLPLVPAMRGQP